MIVSVCVCVCVCVFVCLRSYLQNYTSDLRSDMLCTPGSMDDVILFAHKPRLLDVAALLKRSAHAALGLVINCAQ